VGPFRYPPRTGPGREVLRPLRLRIPQPNPARWAGMGLGVLLFFTLPPAQPRDPAWNFSDSAGAVLTELWQSSSAQHRERIACLAGETSVDSVRVSRARILDESDADSLAAAAEASIETCGPPEWIGTAHTHLRSTDDSAPAPRFSPGDRAVMSSWSGRWHRPGALCVIWSVRNAHCEVYPPAATPRVPPRQ